MNLKTLKHIIRQQILQEYFMTETETRADLEPVVKKSQFAALGKPVAKILDGLTELDEMQPRPFHIVYERFLLENGCEKLGTGLSRITFAVNDEVVIKLQQDFKLNQNAVEANPGQATVFHDMIPAIYAVSKYHAQWIACERVMPVDTGTLLLEWLDKTGFIKVFDKINYIKYGYSDKSKDKALYEILQYVVRFAYEVGMDYRHAAKTQKDVPLTELLKVCHENKYCDVLLRARASFGFDPYDIHTDNIGLTYEDKRPVFLDTGYRTQ
jgi:hypothetical protein